MGFWKNLRAALAHPDIVSELETERMTRKQLSQTLAAAEGQLADTETDAEILEEKLKRMTTRVDACRTALRALCSSPPTLEELKRIYEATAPIQDPYGLGLYFSAKTLTGIELSTEFPYEDGQGLFEDAKGPELLRYLTAARFGAVTWEAVPGTDHKKAVLGEVDTATPEYRAFELALYNRKLEWAGFGIVYAPAKEQQLPEHHKNEKKRGEAR